MWSRRVHQIFFNCTNRRLLWLHVRSTLALSYRFLEYNQSITAEIHIPLSNRQKVQFEFLSSICHILLGYHCWSSPTLGTRLWIRDFGYETLNTRHCILRHMPLLAFSLTKTFSSILRIFKAKRHSFTKYLQKLHLYIYLHHDI